MSISTDGGDSFTKRTTANGIASDYAVEVYAKGNTIYVACGSDGTTGGLSISTDGGNSFTKRTTANGFNSNNVIGVFATNSTIYVGTGEGLFFCTDAALPVNLVSFVGGWQAGQGASLSWQTAWEKNNDHFEIQRSLDAKSFEAIGRVNGKGTQQATTDYSFTDTQMPGDLAYYRLKQVDTDGGHTFSSIISVRRGVDNRPAGLSINPNPVQKTLALKLSAGQLKTVRIFDLGGRLVQTASVLMPDVSGLETGSYVVEVTTTSGQVLKQRFIKE